MIDRALRFGQILAGADFSPSDAGALRGDLIATFRKEPAKETEEYESVAKIMQERPGRKSSWLDLALIRYKVWQSYGENQQAFRDFQGSPFGKMVPKYNPVLVNSGGMVVIKTDVDWQFCSDALVAKAAGVAPRAEAERDRFARDFASQFAFLQREQQEYLKRAELRLVDFYTVYEGPQDARHRGCRHPEKRPLFGGRLARSPQGGERLPAWIQVLPALSLRGVERRPQHRAGECGHSGTGETGRIRDEEWRAVWPESLA